MGTPEVGQVITFDQLRAAERNQARVQFDWAGVNFSFVPTGYYGEDSPSTPVLMGEYKFGEGSPPTTMIQVGVPVSLVDTYKNRLALLRLIDKISGHVGVHVQCERAFRRTNGLSMEGA